MAESLPNLRLLVVDDNHAIHDDFRKILLPPEDEADPFETAAFGRAAPALVRGHFEIDSAYQGHESLERVCQAADRGRPYAVVFMDIRMPPGWDGVETTARLWARDPDLQVVICTAYSDYSWEEMTAKLGQSDRLVILKKPFDPIEVVQLANCLTQKWHFLQEAKTKLAELEHAVAERTAQIRQEQARFQAIFENSPMGIFQTSESGKMLYANPASVRLLGYASAAELIHELADVGAHLYVDGRRREEFKRLLQQNGIVRDFEIEVKCKNGTHKWLNLMADVVPASDGSGSYFEGFFSDITDRKLAEQERKEMEIQLRHAQKMESIGRLSAGIAHEINTPAQYVGDNIHFLRDSFASILSALTAFEHFVQLAKCKNVLPEAIAAAESTLAAANPAYVRQEIPAALDQTLDGVRRISKIVGAMREFSHPGSREKSLADLNRAIETTVVIARNEWKYVAEMKLELDPALPSVNCFVGEFNQAILNLVINAAQAIGDVVQKTPGAKGQITIHTSRRDQDVEIRISDTGAGIPDEIRPHIFEPFFTTKEVGKGTGQGLTVVYNSIVKLHQGAVAFESALGRGTTFILRLPVA